MNALSIRGLQKTYASGLQAVKGIDLDIPEGEFFALLGPNGAGKSTTIGIISSLVNKTAGTVSVFGHDLDSKPEAVKACIGLVPQEFNFNMFEPVEEIVINQAGFYGIPRSEAKIRAERYLKQLDLWDRRRTEARQLSGGMKRRLMIARALVHKPGLLILDEPTAGVDIEIRRGMWDFLRQTNAEGTSIILTTHYLEEAESLCRQIAIIDHGRIIEQARMSELLRRLNTETFVLTMDQPCTSAPEVPGYPMCLRDDGNLEVSVDQTRGVNDLFVALNAQGLKVSSLRNKQNRLEQLFIDMVEAGRIPKEAQG